MPHDEHHEHLIKEITEQFEPVFSNSPQGVYLYLDDTHKICNQKFADMLGYKSVEEWVANETPVEDVVEEDRDRAIEAYGKASDDFEASKISVGVTKKDGSKLSTEIIMAPVTYRNEVFVLHFVSEK